MSGLRAVAKRWWAPISLVAGLAIGWVLTLTPVGSTIFRFVPPIGIAVIALVCFRDLARRDRIAFLSIVGPAMALALMSTIVPRVAGWLLAMASIGFVAFFVFGTQAMRNWWWRHVLRRRIATAGQRFEYGLLVEVQAWSQALRGEGALSDEQRAAATQATQVMRTLEPPDAAWSALRDAYADLCERWIALPRDEAHVSEAEAFQAELASLGDRRAAHHERADR